ncbi:MAG: hypothetical protein JO125_01495 [Chloroflexi bacterium]|nr:hypothetical protein [Ktedonobacteraceae bacterium]MBV9706064.1 hypothetical protein [Chloroflexota bacterium]
MLRHITRWFIALIALTLIAVTLLVSNGLSSHAAAPSHTTTPVQQVAPHQVSPNWAIGVF